MLLAFVVVHTLRKHLVFNVHGGGPGLLQDLHRAHDMNCISVARASIDHDRNIHGSGHASRSHGNFLKAEQRLRNARTRAKCVTTNIQQRETQLARQFLR